MIEWIKITPETEFPMDISFICLDIKNNCTSWLFDYGTFIPSNYNVIKYNDSFENIEFIYYSVVHILDIKNFISKNGKLANEMLPQKNIETSNDHRLTLRIPQWLMDKVDEKRKERVGSISRNLWILEQIEKACK